MMYNKIVVMVSVLACRAMGSVVAPIYAPALSYTRAVPYNIPPFAASVNVFNRLFHAPVVQAAPAILPHARSIHPIPAPLHFAHAPIPQPLHAPIGHPFAPAVAAPLAGPVPHALPAAAPVPFPYHLPAPLPHAVPAPLPHAVAAHAPFPYAQPAPLPHPVAAPFHHAALPEHLPHVLPGPLPHAVPWRR